MIISADNMQEFFKKALIKALEGTKESGLTEDVQAYVVNLLVEFSRSERAFAGTEQGEKPALALLMARAIDALPQEALRIYRHVGDSSLYLLGYFSEAIEQEVVDASYYQAMGETGYSYVAAFIKEGSGSSSAGMYSELAERFADLVSLLHRMRLYNDLEGQDAPTDKKILDWIVQYEKTKDPELLKKLRDQGVDLNVMTKASIQ